MIPAGYVASLHHWALADIIRLPGCTLSPNSTTVVCLSTTGLTVGAPVQGCLILQGVTIVSITDATHFVISETPVANGDNMRLTILGPRSLQLLALRDDLVTGQLTTKAVSTMTSAGANGKNFTFLPSITAAEKLPLVDNVLGRLGLTPRHGGESISYGNFTGLVR